MHKYKLTIEYDGTNYAGWQKQHHAITVQQAIEEAIFCMTNQKAEVVVAGRTDAGVHAKGQVAHVELEKDWRCFNLRQGINHYLAAAGHGVSILNAEIVDNEFHARFSAQKRTYRYYILNRAAPSPIHKLRAWHVFEKLDIEKMQQAAKYLEGQHNFNSFRAAECQAQNPVRTIDYIKFIICNEVFDVDINKDFLIIEICGKSFLHNMVRNIVGTLKQVGTGHIAPDKIPEIIKAENRQAAGLCAPAHGLYFQRVEY